MQFCEGDESRLEKIVTVDVLLRLYVGVKQFDCAFGVKLVLCIDQK